VIEQALKMHHILETPRTTVTPETIDKIYNIILFVRRVKVRKLTEAMDTSTERIHFILHNELNMKKLFAKWFAAFAHCRAKASSYANIS